MQGRQARARWNQGLLYHGASSERWYASREAFEIWRGVVVGKSGTADVQALRAFGRRGASVYYCIGRCPDGSAVMVLKHEELTPEGDALVHRSKVSEWNGLSTHATSRCWLDELNAGVKVARLGIRHRAGKFAARPDMIGRMTRWDGEHFEVVFRPEVEHGTTNAQT